ncbi:MAG: DegV family protein [Breznakia sp.]
MKIAVLTDSGGGLSKQEADALGIFYLPLQIIDGDDVYLDGENVSTEKVFQMIKEEKMLKTSLPPMGMMEALFQELKVQGYEHVINIPLNPGLSGTAQSIIMLAEQNDMPITSFDTYTTAGIQAYLSKAAKRLVDEGVALDEICKRIENSIAHSNTLIIPNDLHHLKRGGRLTPLAATLGGMLKIKPILNLNKASNGKIDTFAKVRTMSKAMKLAVETLSKEGIGDDYVLAILHTGSDDVKELEDLYFSKYPKNEYIRGFIAPILSVHTGLGCMGIQYIKKV